MKKKILCLFLAIVLTLGNGTILVFANDGGGEGESISPYATGLVGFTTKRISDTKAAASVSVDFTTIADEFTITLTLQKKSGSSWVTATDVTNYQVRYRGTNRDGYQTYDEWTVKKGVVYRIKCVSVDKYTGISYTSTTYSDPF